MIVFIILQSEEARLTCQTSTLVAHTTADRLTGRYDWLELKKEVHVVDNGAAAFVTKSGPTTLEQQHFYL